MRQSCFAGRDDAAKEDGFGIPVQRWLGNQGQQATRGPALLGWAGWVRQIVEAY